MMKKTICFLLLVMFSLNASPEKVDLKVYSRQIPEILVTYSGVSADNVVLSDGSQWKVRGEGVETIISSWSVGDDIRVGTTEKEPKNVYVLKNMRKSRSYLVDLVISEPAAGWSILEIDQNGYSLITEEGHQWTVGYLGSFISSTWAQGDLVFINKSTYYNSADYMLIHASDGSHIWASMIKWK